MPRNNTPILIAAIVLGVLALGATAFIMLGGHSTQPPPQQVVAVPTPTPAARYVAARNIPPRTVIDKSMLVQSIKGGAVPTGAITSLDDVTGMLTREPISQGETVLLSSFTPRLKRQVDANIPIPTGYRGVAIWVDPDQTAAGLVDVGDRVDVIATHKLSWDKGPNQYVNGALNFSTGRTIAQYLLVLGVDKSIKAPPPTPTPAPATAGAPGAAPPPPPPPTPVPVANGPATRTRVLLAAPPDIAARLVAANDQGVLHITIRNPADGDQQVVPEAHEYPSRLFTIRPAQPNSGKTTSVPTLPRPMPMPTMIAPALLPTPLPTLPGQNQFAPEDKEITVIRGTEKTRVVVPQR